VDRRAWHLAAATVGPDAEAAAALEQAGARAAARSAYAAAAAAYEHAARLSTDEDERASLVVAASRPPSRRTVTKTQSRAAFLAQMALGVASVAAGDGHGGIAATRRAVEILERTTELRDDPWLLGWAALGPLWLREAETGRKLLDRAFDEARTRAALGVLPGLLHLLARDQATTDAWRAAQSSYRRQFASRRRAASASSSQRRWRASRGSRRARAASKRAAHTPRRRADIAMS
jgi:hypothetical protein